MAFRCLRLLALAFTLRVAACGSDDDGGSATSATGGSGGAGRVDETPAAGGALDLPYAPCSDEAAVGEFSIELAPDFTSVDGKVFDGVNPALVPDELASDGACRLVTLPNLLCDPGCPATTQVCAEGNQCVPLPLARDVGTVSVSGMARAIEMTPNAATGNYRPPPPALPHPGFAPGADLRLSASGGAYAPFELRGWGIAALEVTPGITVTEGQPVAIVWAPPASAGPARLHARLNINNHGSSNTWIECDFDDTGAAEIPALLVDGLIAEGASGFPSITLARRTASSTSIEPGCVQLLVQSTLDLDVSLTGLTSCDTDVECPDGQTCKPVERYCE